MLYPAPVRDLLLCLAEQQLYRPKWSELIQEEWKRNLLQNRPDLKETRLNRTIEIMNLAFPDAEVNGYSSLIQNLTLPDKDDRHVLAAAIRSRSDVIVTFNLKDFPGKFLDDFQIESVHPDVFIVNLIELDEEKGITAFNQQVGQLKNPYQTAEYVLEKLKKSNLNQSVKLIREILKSR